jgi:predicted HicB family RNase H-like nuclease
MPSAPKTPTRTVRVPDELWLAAQKEAAKQNVTVTSVLIEALEKFVTDGLDKVTE